MKFGKGRVNSVQSRAQHTFAQVPKATIPRSSFNRSHGYKTTFNEGYLVPVYLDEILPGDTFNLRMTAFGRLSTPLFPIMDNLYLDVHFFFVPNRLVWSHWENFNGAQDNPTDSTSYVIPQLVSPASGGFVANSLADYFGLPVGVASLSVNALPFRAYNLIYNTWYRDQNLQTSVYINTGDGPDPSPATNYVLMQRGKRHDYFTSCLPWPQKINDGSTLNVPLQGTAPIIGIGLQPGTNHTGPLAGNKETGGGTATYANYAQASADANVVLNVTAGSNGSPLIYANLSGATGVTINELREAFQVQKMFERDARGGTRYIEIVKSHFGVDSPDARLQRPEYLGGGSSSVNVTPIPNTTGTDTAPQGTLAAYGTMSIHNAGFVKSFVEHGYVIGLVSLRADLNYQQGLDRMWSRTTRYDFFWPALSHIGEQAVLNKEIYCQGTSDDNSVFGYQERFGEYRYFPGKITGEFRSSFAQSLDSWHLAQEFGSLPALNSAFIVEAAPMDRILAVGADGPHVLFDSFFSLKCARPMPVYGVPGLVDHF